MVTLGWCCSFQACVFVYTYSLHDEEKQGRELDSCGMGRRRLVSFALHVRLCLMGLSIASLWFCVPRGRGVKLESTTSCFPFHYTLIEVLGCATTAMISNSALTELRHNTHARTYLLNCPKRRCDSHSAEYPGIRRCPRRPPSNWPIFPRSG